MTVTRLYVYFSCILKCNRLFSCSFNANEAFTKILLYCIAIFILRYSFFSIKRQIVGIIIVTSIIVISNIVDKAISFFQGATYDIIYLQFIFQKLYPSISHIEKRLYINLETCIIIYWRSVFCNIIHIYDRQLYRIQNCIFRSLYDSRQVLIIHVQLLYIQVLSHVIKY